MNTFLTLLECPTCHKSLKRDKNGLVCTRGHKFEYTKAVAKFANLNSYLEHEAQAWESSWRDTVPKKSMKVYEKNMKIFKKLGFWEESAEAASSLPTTKNDLVLDLGCGNGYSTANIKAKLAVGVDLSHHELAAAKKKYPKCEFVVADARQLPFATGTFDKVVAINMLHHVLDPEKVLNECNRVLKPGGTFISVDPNLTNPFGYTTRGLFRLLQLKRIFPRFPQFALGEDEYQFTFKRYNKLFQSSKFSNYKIRPHRFERVLFLASIVFPFIADLPFYSRLAVFSSVAGNKLVSLGPLKYLCYFWICEAHK